MAPKVISLVGLPGHGAFFKFAATKDEDGNEAVESRKFNSADEFQQEVETNPDRQWFDNPKLEEEIPVQNVEDLRASLDKKIAALQAENESLKDSARIAAMQVESLTSQLAASKKEADELEVELDKAEKDLETANKKIAVLSKPTAAAKPAPAAKAETDAK